MIHLLNKKEKVLATATVSAGILFLLIRCVVLPVAAENVRLNRDIRQAEAKYGKYAYLVARKDAIRKQVNAATARPSGGDEKSVEMGVLASLQEMAQACGARILDLRPLGTRAEKGASRFAEVTLELRTEGPYESQMKFIHAVETSLALLRIKKMQLSAKPRASVLEGVFTITQPSFEE